MQPPQVAHQRFFCALKAHFEYQNALLMRIKSAGVAAGVLPGTLKKSHIANKTMFLCVVYVRLYVCDQKFGNLLKG